MSDAADVTPSEKASTHIDARVSADTRTRYYALFHKCAPGKTDDSMDAFVRFLVDQGEKSLTSVGVRNFRP